MAPFYGMCVPGIRLFIVCAMSWWYTRCHKKASSSVVVTWRYDGTEFEWNFGQSAEAKREVTSRKLKLLAVSRTSSIFLQYFEFWWQWMSLWSHIYGVCRWRTLVVRECLVRRCTSDGRTRQRQDNTCCICFKDQSLWVSLSTLIQGCHGRPGGGGEVQDGKIPHTTPQWYHGSDVVVVIL